MAAVGGSIESISIAGRELAVTSDADASRNLGGFQNEVQANGDGSARIIKTRVNWSISGLTVVVDDVRGDQEFLQGIADRKEFVPVAITLASGAVYQGSGTIVDEIATSSNSATAGLSLMGEGALSKQ